MSEVILALEFTRALQESWGDREATVIGEQEPARSSGVRISAHQRLAQRIQAIVQQVPTRDETIDWLGRRLITWGWQLRMRSGAPRR